MERRSALRRTMRLLRDGRVGRALGAATRDVPVHVEGLEPREPERHVALLLVGLEEAHEVPGLGAVEQDRVRAPPAGLDLFLV